MILNQSEWTLSPEIQIYQHDWKDDFPLSWELHKRNGKVSISKHIKVFNYTQFLNMRHPNLQTYPCCQFLDLYMKFAHICCRTSNPTQSVFCFDRVERLPFHYITFKVFVSFLLLVITSPNVTHTYTGSEPTTIPCSSGNWWFWVSRWFLRRACVALPRLCSWF